jgi:hypothetical protein
MTAGQYNKTIEQGTTLNWQMNYKDCDGNLIDLGGYNGRMQIRDYFSGELLAEMTTSNGGMEINNPTGRIKVMMSATATAALTFKRARYDIELISGTTVTRLLEGEVILSREVTT